MARPRLLALLLASAAALAVAGCGNKEEAYTFGGTEGVYVSVDDLKYQVQISRILNPADIEDQGYLKGISKGVAPTKDEVWFAIFMRVENDADASHTAADSFEIRDTQGNTFKPLNLDQNVNLFTYKPRVVTPGTQIPAINSPALLPSPPASVAAPNTPNPASSTPFRPTRSPRFPAASTRAANIRL